MLTFDGLFDGTDGEQWEEIGVKSVPACFRSFNSNT